MNVILTGKDSIKRRMVECQVHWTIQQLKLSGSRCNLEIIPQKNLRRDTGGNALTGRVANTIGLVFDTGLSVSQLMVSIAHEMIHVKQLARGTLIYEMRDGEEIAIWRGKKLDLPYFDRPWEIEAYGKQEILARRFNAAIEEYANVNVSI